MPISRIFWTSRSQRDIHVLRGQATRDLTIADLVFVETGPPTANKFAARYFIDHPAPFDVDLSFTPQFSGSAVSAVADNFVGNGNGITVNKKTGVVTVAAGAPTRRKNNFIIEVVATNTADPTKPFNEVIRVQVHNSVSRVWLTPVELTVRPTSAPRPEATGYRFSVRAQFDDGVVGELSSNHGVTFTSVPAGGVAANGELLIPPGSNPHDRIIVTVTLPAALGGGSNQAAVIIGQPWASEPTPPKVSIVVGGGWPGTISPEQVPNILILGDGFTAGDQSAFEQIANTFVHHLKTNRFTRPFDLLVTSMNFWKTFVAAPSNGISVLSEVYTFTDGGRLVARALPICEKPPPTGDWTIRHLMYAVGLPIPGEESKTNAALKTEWAQLVTPNPTPHLNDDLIDYWKRCAKRAFIEERDGFPSLSYGTTPAANSDDNNFLNLHNDRGGTAGLRPFYDVLTTDTGVALAGSVKIGQLWARRDPTFNFDNTDLVLIVSSFPGGRAVNGEGYVALSTKAGNVNIPVRSAAPGVNAYFLDLATIPTSVSADRCRTVAHELGHSFGLDDEYVDFDKPYPFTEAELVTFANLQTDADIRIAAQLNSAQIKWNWHRIRKAAVVSGPITAVGTQFLIPLERGRSLQFAANDKVLLRRRTFGEPLQKASLVLLNTLPDAKQLQIVAALSNAVMVQPAPGSTATLADLTTFTRGSLLYIPTPAPAAASPLKYANMVAKNIADFINTNRPLTVMPCVLDKAPTQTPILDGVSLPGVFCFKHKPKIVGLYSGGAQYSCGIFHPTGTCMMRSHNNDESEFCAVCRYIMVDLIDPFRHFEIDLDYDDIYPLD